MKKSRVCALGLACFLGAVTAFSALAPTSGGGALLRNLSDNSELSSASLSGQNASENLTPEEQAKAELDANILAGGGLGLDPENDPVVATTDWGLDIYFHNAGEGTWQTSISTNGSVSTAALSGYLYFQGGNYNGVTGLKWVIIGYSTKTASAGPVSGINVNVNPDTTDAGTLIKNYASKGMVYVNSYKSPTFTNAVGTTEIPVGCVLCISEKNLLLARFKSEDTKDSDGYYIRGRWLYSDLRTTMSNLYKTDITNFDLIRYKIQNVTLRTAGVKNKGDGLSSWIHAIETSTDHFFTLAAKNYNNGSILYDPTTYPQDYYIETYFGNPISNTTKAISYDHGSTTEAPWWLRTGHISASWYYAYAVTKYGTMDMYSMTSSIGVRPAFVLKL